MRWILLASVARLAASAEVQQTVISVDLETPLTSVLDSYVSFNLDMGSLYNDFDFEDAMLTQLVRNLAVASPTQLRFGGSAANDVTYTGDGGPRGNCSANGATRICVDDSLWEEVNTFAARTGVQLVWDLAILPRTPDNAWNSTNSAALIERTAKSGYNVSVWQLGNEEGSCCSSVQVRS
jgi:hypothetical protein